MLDDYINVSSESPQSKFLQVFAKSRSGPRRPKVKVPIRSYERKCTRFEYRKTLEIHIELPAAISFELLAEIPRELRAEMPSELPAELIADTSRNLQSRHRGM